MKNNGLCFAVLLLMSTATFAGQQFYKYTDKDGNIIISNNLPPEVANDGYSIVTSRGNVIEVVLPKKTEAELSVELQKQKQLLEKKRQAEIAKQLKEKQAQKDEIILKTFSNMEDIIRSRDDKIAAINVLEGITKENINRLKKQLKSAKASAARYERSGSAVPQKLANTISQSQRQIEDNRQFLLRKEQEKQAINLKFDALLKRFKELQRKSPADH